MVRMTAAKCVLMPQLEVLLKVKQAGNHEFAFLQPYDDYHTYYVWLKEQKRQVQTKKAASNDIKERDEKGGLSLLHMYSSSSDDEESSSPPPKMIKVAKEQTKNIPEVSQVSSVSNAQGSPQKSDAWVPVNDDNDKHPRHDDDDAVAAATAKRARRLKRAKLMSGHYRLQLMGSDMKNP